MTTPNESETNGIGRRTALKKGLLVTTIAGVGIPAGFGGVATAGLGQGVVAHYQLNNLKGQGQDKTEVHDSSPNDNDGTAFGDVAPVDGKVENSFEFDGDGDYVEVPDDDSLDLVGDALTVAAWFKTTSTSRGGLVRKNDSNNWWPAYNLEVNRDTAGEVEFLLRDSDPHNIQIESTSTNLNDGEWHHAAGTYDPNTDEMILYIDGQEEATTTESFDAPDTTGALQLGRMAQATTSTAYFDGKLDDVYVYNRALDEDEICQLFMRGLEDELVAYYPLDEFADTTVVPDESENDNDGEAFGDPTVVGGLVDNAFAFDGNDDQVTVDPFTDLSGGPVTVAAWVFPQSAPNRFSNVLSLADQTGSNRTNSVLIQHRGEDAGDPFLFGADDGTGSVTSITSEGIGTGNWHHVALTQDGSNLRAYLDGSEISTSPVSVSDHISIATNVARLAQNAIGNSVTLYDAKIDEVRIYDRALPASEIEGLHHCQSP